MRKSTIELKDSTGRQPFLSLLLQASMSLRPRQGVISRTDATTEADLRILQAQMLRDPIDEP